MALNTSQPTISAFELGQRTPDLNMLINMSKFFGVSIDYLACQSDIKHIMQSSDLSSNELEHLYHYRQLSDIEKEKLSAYMDGLQSK